MISFSLMPPNQNNIYYLVKVKVETVLSTTFQNKFYVFNKKREK